MSLQFSDGSTDSPGTVFPKRLSVTRIFFLASMGCLGTSAVLLLGTGDDKLDAILGLTMISRALGIVAWALVSASVAGSWTEKTGRVLCSCLWFACLGYLHVVLFRI